MQPVCDVMCVCVCVCEGEGVGEEKDRRGENITV